MVNAIILRFESQYITKQNILKSKIQQKQILVNMEQYWHDVGTSGPIKISGNDIGPILTQYGANICVLLGYAPSLFEIDPGV